MIARVYAQWVAIPAAIRAPLRSAFVSFVLGLTSAIATFFTAYFYNPELHGQTWAGFFRLLGSPAFAGAAATAVAAAYRARQGFRAATTVVETDTAISVPKKQ